MDDFILVPIDGSDDSVKAAYYAIDIAKSMEYSVVLLYVISPHSGREKIFDVKEKIRGCKEKALTKGVKASVKFRKGLAWQEIVRESRRGYKQVVIGSRGLTGFKRMLLGSVAENVVRHSKCPVTIVK